MTSVKPRTSLSLPLSVLLTGTSQKENGLTTCDSKDVICLTSTLLHTPLLNTLELSRRRVSEPENSPGSLSTKEPEDRLLYERITQNILKQQQPKLCGVLTIQLSGNLNLKRPEYG